MRSNGLTDTECRRLKAKSRSKNGKAVSRPLVKNGSVDHFSNRVKTQHRLMAIEQGAHNSFLTSGRETASPLFAPFAHCRVSLKDYRLKLAAFVYHTMT